MTAPKHDGFTLWLVEDFTQPLDLVHDPIWTYSDGGFETHRFTRDAITFEPGKMVLTLSDTKVASSCSYSNTGLVQARERKSGERQLHHLAVYVSSARCAWRVLTLASDSPCPHGSLGLWIFQEKSLFWR